MSQSLFISLLVANACLVLLCILYYTVYGRYTFYRFNRWLLLAGLLLCSSLPFCRLPFPERPAIVLQVTAQLSDTTAVTRPFTTPAFISFANITTVLLVLFVAGMVWGTIRLLIRLYSIYCIHIGSKVNSYNGMVFRQVSLPVAPFAFMGHIYLNPSSCSTAQIEAILLHEEVHIRGRHTIDMLVAELVQLIFWYNPWMPLLKQALAQNLEYLTDKVMINSVMERTQYQYSLLHTATQNQYVPLTNAFLFTHLKNRLNMMNKNQTHAGFKLSYLLALPFLGATAWISSAGYAQQQKVIIKQIQQTTAAEQKGGQYGSLLNPENTITVKAVKNTAMPVNKQMLLETQAVQHAQPEQVNIAIKATAVEVTHGATQVSAQQITVMPQGSEEEVQVTVQANQQRTGNALIIIDEVIKDEVSLSDIDPKTIVSVQVLKDAASIEQYGDKARDGVIKVVTKKAK